MKKPLPSSVVNVAVRAGTENHARAGKGGYARTASSTNSPYYAARLAAAKYFRCEENRVSLSYQGEVDRVVTFSAIRCDKPATFVTIEFEDKGQDFASWVVCLETGHVIDCKPFQYSVWSKCVVLEPKRLKRGVCPRIISGHGEGLTLNYAITKITKKDGAS